jgi:hypothetical protein
MRKPILIIGVFGLCVLLGAAAYFLSGVTNQLSSGSISLISDIEPGVGAGTPPPGSSPGLDGPWNHRIMEATAGISVHAVFGGDISYQMYLSRGPFIFGLYFSHTLFSGFT